MTTTEADPRSVELGVDRWLTDARAYNLLWLGRWLERAYEICRELLWLAQQEADESAGAGCGGAARLGRRRAGDVGRRGLDAPGRAAQRAQRRVGARLPRIGALQRHVRRARRTDPEPRRRDRAVEAEEAQPATLAEAADLLRRMLAIMDEAHSTVEQAWFHSEPLSEEEVYQRFVQQQQQQQPAAQTQTAGDQ